MFSELYGKYMYILLLSSSLNAFSNLTGKNACTMNVHLLKHIPECVQNWGPLWAYSCFPFESMNGHLKKYFHGTKNMNTQVMSLYRFIQVVSLYIMNFPTLAGLFLPDGSSIT